MPNTTFDTGCANNAQDGNVDGQDPAGNAQVASGGTVNISVCQSNTTTSSTTSTTNPGPGGTTTTVRNGLLSGGPRRP